MNLFIATGRLGRDPESNTITRGNGNQTTMATFTLAVDRGFKDADGNRITDWFNCSVFGKTAEHVMQYYRKGMKANCVGKIEINKGTNKEGNPVTYTNYRIDTIEFGESKATAEANRVQDSSPAASAPTVEPIDTFQSIPDSIMEDLPFN